MYVDTCKIHTFNKIAGTCTCVLLYPYKEMWLSVWLIYHLIYRTINTATLCNACGAFGKTTSWINVSSLSLAVFILTRSLIV